MHKTILAATEGAPLATSGPYQVTSEAASDSPGHLHKFEPGREIEGHQ